MRWACGRRGVRSPAYAPRAWFTRRWSMGMDEAQALNWLSRTFDVSEHKSELLGEIVRAQRPVICHDTGVFDCT